MSDDTFISRVHAAGSSDKYERVVKIANPEEIGNAQEVDALPTPSEDLRNILYRLTTDNLLYYLNDAGTGWVALDRGSPTEVVSVDGQVGEVKINTRAAVAGEAMSAHRVARISADGKAYYASSANVAHASGTIGITSTAAGLGDALTIAADGVEITEGTWSWTPGTRVYLNGTSGQLSASAPASGYSRQIGIALTATLVRVQLGEVVILA